MAGCPSGHIRQPVRISAFLVVESHRRLGRANDRVRVPRQYWARRPLVNLLLSLLVATAIGVAANAGRRRKLHESNLRLVAVLYSQYLAAHGGETPRDEGDFRAFVHSLGPAVLERVGLAGLDELFVSRRNGQPFAVKYQGGGWALDGAIAHEQEGASGTRYVATELGGVSEF